MPMKTPEELEREHFDKSCMKQLSHAIEDIQDALTSLDTVWTYNERFHCKSISQTIAQLVECRERLKLEKKAREETL